jgi:uncharacterized membrane protein
VAALLVALWQEARLAALLSVAPGWRRWLDAYTWPWVRRGLLMVAALGGGAIVLYLPFYLNFQSFVTGVGFVAHPTDPMQFLLLFGVWLFLIGTFLAVELADWLREAWLGGQRGDDVQRSLITAFVVVTVVTLGILGGVKVMVVWLALAAAALLVRRGNDTGRQFAYVLVLAGALVALLVEVIYLRDFLDGGDYERMNTVFKFYYQVWLLWALGAAITVPYLLRHLLDWARNKPATADAAEADLLPTDLATTDEAWLYPEAFASEDDAPVEDNTIDGAQLGLGYTAPPPMEDFDPGPVTGGALAFAKGTTGELPVIAGPPPRVATGRRTQRWLGNDASDEVVALGLRGAWLVALVVLLFGSSIFAFAGTRVRVTDRTQWGTQVAVQPLQSVPSLDGFGYMHTWYPGDAAAITWMNEHISGTPTILEATGNPYQWYSRVTINTGLPTIVGWGSHETQQRYPDEIYPRQNDVLTIYTVKDPALVLPLLHRYHVRYVYQGQIECLAYGYGITDLTKVTQDEINQCVSQNNLPGTMTNFDTFVSKGLAKLVYRSGGVSIWQITG